MAQIDEKQEAVAKIRMAIDNDVAARARIDAEAAEGGVVHPSVWAAPDPVSGHSPHWMFGAPERPINSRLLERDMCVQGHSSFKEFDERLRDFLFVCLPNEAIRYEDPISVSLNTHCQQLLLIGYSRSSYINVSTSNTNRLKIGQNPRIFFDVTLSFMARNDMTVSFQKAAA